MAISIESILKYVCIRTAGYQLHMNNYCDVINVVATINLKKKKKDGNKQGTTKMEIAATDPQFINSIEKWPIDKVKCKLQANEKYVISNKQVKIGHFIISLECRRGTHNIGL